MRPEGGRRGPARACALALAVAGCAAAPQPTPGCTGLAPTGQVEAHYAAGVRGLEAAREGEHYRSGAFEDAMQALRFAAENGSRSAQSLYGRTLFAVRFTSQAPGSVPGEQAAREREDYVAALAFVRVAALSGDADAARFLPPLVRRPPDPSEPPLASLPPEWIEAAVGRADAWLACHGPARAAPATPGD